MLDTILKPKAAPYLETMAEKLNTLGVRPNQITLYGFVVGMVGCIAIAFGSYLFGLFLILLNRLTDGLDGAVARYSKHPVKSKQEQAFGQYLDTVLDMILYGAFVFSFGFASVHSGAASFLLFSLLGVFVTGLSAHMITGIDGKNTDKEFHHPTRWIEETELIIMMVLSCLMPAAFGFFAVIFGIACWGTTGSRIWEIFQHVNQGITQTTPTNTTAPAPEGATTTQETAKPAVKTTTKKATKKSAKKKKA